MAANPKYEAMDMEMGDGDGPEDEGAESSYGITFTAEDAAVRGNRDVVLPSNILSAIAGASPNAAPGYGLLSSSNPALDVDYARDAVIPGDDSVDVTQESLIVEEPLDETPADEMEEEDDTVACLQMVGVIPFILDTFKPRCSLHIKFRTGNELRNGDILHLREIADERPSIAIIQPSEKETDALLPGNLFTVIMVEVDGGQYLHWALVNFSDKSGSQNGLELVNYEPPSRRLTQGRRPYMFVCYSQSQPFHLMPTIGRQSFDLRSFAATYALDNPVAAIYVTVASE
ncbi:hypothetical protein KC19_9G169500 [Ceratodon purpureus]|uniref:Uncharacterized protein n=1 Tax=Ceratodon purpureus TaxID=3225 RepID=A0A8T0GWH1_CERPU|nr:hypothetical protein KC19_9G169500 [Ceratodon purpureus]